MKIYLVAFLMIVAGVQSAAQQKQYGSIYNPRADADADIAKAVTVAAREHKNVLVQVGGNWCSWCIKLHKLFETNPTIDSLIKADYVFVLANYSPENKNPKAMARLGYPQRFGFPALVVLDGAGRRLHTQDSGLLEGGGAHDPEKVLTFLRNWTPGALDPAKYN